MPNQVQGHRERLRQRFAADPASFTNEDLLELLLMYAIPQRDVAPCAQALLSRFGSLAGVLEAPMNQLTAVNGVGDYTAVLLQLVSKIRLRPDKAAPEPLQPVLIDPVFDAASRAAADDASQHPEAAAQDAVAPEPGTEFEEDVPGRLGAFVNDEVVHTQEFLPLAHRFVGYDDFRSFLWEQLPYNAASTRRRRANHILNRFFPGGRWDLTLVQFFQNASAPEARDAVLFYHLARAEQLLAKIAEEFVWPALPQGLVTREEMRAFVLHSLPALSASSQANVLRSVFTAYGALGVATIKGEALHIRFQPGHLDSFVYVLANEFPQPGIYRFDQLDQGPMRKWLLWDKEWMRRQLYVLRDAGIIAKVSEIDAWRQFTLSRTRAQLLQAYLDLERQDLTLLREHADTADTADTDTADL